MFFAKQDHTLTHTRQKSCQCRGAFRKVTDGFRPESAIKGIVGKRLSYKDLVGKR